MKTFAKLKNTGFEIAN